MLETPVVLIIFKRPDLTKRVLDTIALAKPRRLLVVADGPREGRPGEREQCEAARAVIDRIDWDCEVLKNYSDVNRGCGRGPATAVSWAFEHVEEAIILEDDCVPHPSFFTFCEELLQRYRDDERVMHIAGSSYRRTAVPTAHSYYFSKFNGCWGWATWRRAWSHFDASVNLWPELRETSWLRDLLEDERAVRMWANEFEVAHQRDGNVSYWDYQWTFACWAHSGLSATAGTNLVSNVGWGPDATHTVSNNDPMSHLPVNEMTFPLNHPPNVLQQRQVDREFLREVILSRLEAVPIPPSPLRLLASRVAPGFVKQAYRTCAAALRPARRVLSR